MTVDICVFDYEVIRKMFLSWGTLQVSSGIKTPCFPKEKAVYRFLSEKKPLSALGDLVLFVCLTV